MPPLIRAALYLAVSGLFGSALLWRSNGVAPGRAGRGWLLACAVAGVPLTAAGLLLQVQAMNGGPPSATLVWTVVRDMPVGRAAAVRLAGFATAALLLLRSARTAAHPLAGGGPGLLESRQPRERTSVLGAVVGLGAVATGSLAWGGHGAAGEGALGLAALAVDIAHLLAAAFWIGAVGALAIMALWAKAESPAEIASLGRTLARFSNPGAIAVAVLVATGLANAWRLIGPQRINALWTDPYGRLLSLKLLLFAAMLACAAANRWRNAVALREPPRSAPAKALRAARLSLALEFAAGLGVLLAVGWMGTLPPPAG